MSQLQIFEHSQFGKIRITDKNGEAWFVASDVATSLGYDNPANAINVHCKKVNKITLSPETGKRDATSNPPINVNIIPLSDVIRLVMRSKLPDAEKFQDWVCEEVLPSIIKTGKYDMSQQTVSNEFNTDTFNIATAIYEKAGLTGNQLTIACDRLFHYNKGYSALVAGGIELKAEVQCQVYTPTEMGRILTPSKSARAVNQMLAELDLQYYDVLNKKWILTETGLEYGFYKDSRVRGKDGTHVLQVKWYDKVLIMLQTVLDKEAIY